MHRKLIFLSLIILGACSEITFDDDTYLKFEEGEINIIDEKFFLSNSSIIQLDNDPGGFFSPGSKILLSNENFYIIDGLGQKAVIQFDDKGNFQQKIGRVGKGPGEYVTLSDAIITSKGIEIMDGNNAKILYYNKSGKYFDQKDYLPNSCIAFAKDENNNQYYFHVGRNGPFGYELLQYDYRKMEIKKKEFPFDVHFPITEFSFSSTDIEGEYLYRRNLEHSLYLIGNNTVNKYLTFDFGITRFDPDKIENSGTLLSTFEAYNKHKYENGAFEILKALKNENYLYCWVVHYLPYGASAEAFHIIYNSKENVLSRIGFNKELSLKMRPAFALSETNVLYFSLSMCDLKTNQNWLSYLKSMDYSFDEKGNDLVLMWEIDNE